MDPPHRATRQANQGREKALLWWGRALLEATISLIQPTLLLAGGVVVVVVVASVRLHGICTQRASEWGWSCSSHCAGAAPLSSLVGLGCLPRVRWTGMLLFSVSCGRDGDVKP